MTSVKDYERLLIDRFALTFESLDKMVAVERLNPIAWQLAVGDRDQYGNKYWRPSKITTETAHLEAIYSQLPARFPHLYELLVLSYRWAEVDLQTFTLFANPPGTGLPGLLQEMSKDPTLWKHLREAGYIQFGRGPDMDYDPVCFDISSRKKKGRDYRIVKIDHEQILCFERVEVVEEIAPSFESLLQATIERANLS